MPRVVDKRRKAEAIGRAALQTFRETGYHRARMADIAQAAGIGKGTLYEYFDDKADVLRFLFDDFFSAFKQGALRAIQGAAGPGAQLLALLDFAFDHLSEWEDHCAVYVDYFGAARVGDDKLFSLAEIYDDMGALLRALIEQAQAAGEIHKGVDAIATAELLLSVFDGVVLHGILAGRGCGRSALRGAAVRLLTEGLLAEARPEVDAGAG